MIKFSDGVKNQVIAMGVAIFCMLALIIAALVSTDPGGVAAATCTWDGSIDSNWSTDGNWIGCTTPSTGDVLIFPATASNFTMVNDFGSIDLDSLVFEGGTYSLSGNTVNLGGDITVDNAGQTTISNTINFSGPANSILIPGGTGVLYLQDLVDTGGGTLTVDANGYVVFTNSSILTGGSGEIVKSGLGYLTLNGDGSGYSGDFTLDAGTIQAPAQLSLGDTAGTTTINYGVIELGNATFNETFIATGGIFESVSANATLAGDITVNGQTLFSGLQQRLTINGAISGASGITARGEVYLNGTITLGGQIGIPEGPSNIHIYGTNPTNFATAFVNNIQIYGTGSVADTYLETGGLAPGPNDIGTFTINGNLATSPTTPAGVTFYFEANGPAAMEYDKLIVNGEITLGTGSRLELIPYYSAALSDSYTLIENDGVDPISGTFVGLADEAYFTADGDTFQINYNGGTGNDLVVTRANVINNPPVITSLTATTPVAEGVQTTLNLEFTDLDVSNPHTVTLDWGDSTDQEEFILNAGTYTLSATHAYTTQGSPLILAVVSDGVAQDNENVAITVTNASPLLDNLSITGTNTKTLSGNIIEPGVLDSIQIGIDWGDGGGIQTLNLAAGTTNFTVNHTYTSAGVYTVDITVTDSDGGSNDYSLITNVTQQGNSSSTSSTTSSSNATTSSSNQMPIEVDPIIVLSPTNGSVLTQTTPEFKLKLPGRTDINSLHIYTLRITNSDGTVNDEVLTSLTKSQLIAEPNQIYTTTDFNQSSFVSNIALPAGSYRWIAVGRNIDNQIIAESEILEFEMVNDIAVQEAIPLTPPPPGASVDTPRNLGDIQILWITITPATQEVIANTTSVPIVGAVLSTSAVAIATNHNLFGIVIGLFLPRKRKHWGVVYDALTNKPIAFASLLLKDTNGQPVGQAVSNLAGRFAISADQPGDYNLSVNASGFAPAEITVSVDNNLNALADIPLKLRQVSHRHWRLWVAMYRDEILRGLRWLLGVTMVIGIIYSLIALYISPTLINAILLVMYMFLSLPGIYIIVQNFTSTSHGKVIDADTRQGLAGVNIRIQHHDQATILTHSNRIGKFKLDLPRGKYLAIIHKPGYTVHENHHEQHSDNRLNQISVTIGEDGNITQVIKLHRLPNSESGISIFNPFR